MQLRRVALAGVQLSLEEYARGQPMYPWPPLEGRTIKVQFLDDLKCLDSLSLPSVEFPVKQDGTAGTPPAGLTQTLYFDDWERRSGRALPLLDHYVCETLVEDGCPPSLLFHGIQTKNTMPTSLAVGDEQVYGLRVDHVQALCAAVAEIRIGGLAVTRVLHSIVCPNRARKDLSDRQGLTILAGAELALPYQLEIVTPDQGLHTMVTRLAADIAPDLEGHESDNFSKKHFRIMEEMAGDSDAPVLACAPKGDPHDPEYERCERECLEAASKLRSALSELECVACGVSGTS